MTPRDELRERIARAICDAHDTGAGWDDWAADRQQLYLSMADAALGEVAPVLQALDWYGDESNYDEDGVPGEYVGAATDPETGAFEGEWDPDRGATARAALDGTPSLPAGGGEGLRATLEWYADENNYDPEGAPGEAIGGGRDFDTGAYEIDDWEQDFGRRAREALAAGPARINASSAGAILTTETISRSPQPGCAARRLDDDAIWAAWERVSPRVPATVEMLRSFLSSLSSPLPGAGDGPTMAEMIESAACTMATLDGTVRTPEQAEVFRTRARLVLGFALGHGRALPEVPPPTRTEVAR